MGNYDRYLNNADAVDHLVLECGANGYSLTQIAACVGVSTRTLRTWAATYPRLADALERAETLSQAWWEGRAMDGTAQSRIGASVWSKSMSSRFPGQYADRMESGGIGEGLDKSDDVVWRIVDPKEDE